MTVVLASVLTGAAPPPELVGPPAPPVTEREKVARSLERNARHLPPEKAAYYLKHAKDIRDGTASFETRPATIEELENMLKQLEEVEASAPRQVAEKLKKESEKLRSVIEKMKIQKSKIEKAKPS